MANEEQEAAAAGMAEKLSGRLHFDGAPIAGEKNVTCLNVVAPEVSKVTGLGIWRPSFGWTCRRSWPWATAPTT